MEMLAILSWMIKPEWKLVAGRYRVLTQAVLSFSQRSRANYEKKHRHYLSRSQIHHFLVFNNKLHGIFFLAGQS